MVRTALITGARGGIGSACTAALTQRGVKVIGTSHTETGLRSLREDRNLAGSYLLDLTNVNSIKETLISATEQHGPIDILVNNAAVLHMKSIFDITEETWDETFMVNLKSVFFLSQAMAEHMKTQRWGVIINIASLAGKVGFIDQICYSAAKAGVLSLTRTLARELSAWNIRVHAVSPGAIDTNLFHYCLSWSSKKYCVNEDELLRAWLSPTINHTLISPSHVGDIISYLALNGGLELSGCCWDIDSGVAQY